MERGNDALAAGLHWLKVGDLHHAVELLTRAAKLRPDDVVAHHDLAVAQRLRGLLRPPGAFTAARRAVDLDPTHPVTLTHLALLQWSTRQDDEARFTLEQVIERHPTHRVARYYRGLLHRQAGRLREAIDDLEAAAAPGPGALPGLLLERIHGQLFDLRRAGQDRVEPLSTPLASIASISELLLPGGRSSAFALPLESGPHLTDYGDPLQPRPGVEVTPEKVARKLHGARRVVALTGAGASVDSGLATRKDLWKIFDRDQAVSAGPVFESVQTLWRVIESFLGAEEHTPGAVHQVLAHLPRLDAIVTQNVDDLHQRAATAEATPRPVIELHGTLERTRCERCGVDGGASAGELLRRGALPPRCQACGQGSLRPDVVLFGEWVPAAVLAEAVQWVTSCDVLLVVGCAMDVAPASELPRLAARAGATVIEVKRKPSRLHDALGTWWLPGPATPALLATYEALAALEPLPPLPPSPPPRRPVSHLAVRLPQMGESMTEGQVVKWLYKPGDIVTEGAPMVDIGLDKVDVEIPAPFTGVVVEVVRPEGDIVSVGEPLVILSTDLKGRGVLDDE